MIILPPVFPVDAVQTAQSISHDLPILVAGADPRLPPEKPTNNIQRYLMNNPQTPEDPTFITFGLADDDIDFLFEAMQPVMCTTFDPAFDNVEFDQFEVLSHSWKPVDFDEIEYGVKAVRLDDRTVDGERTVDLVMDLYLYSMDSLIREVAPATRTFKLGNIEDSKITPSVLRARDLIANTVKDAIFTYHRL